MSEGKQLTDTDIIEYLADNPDFFVGRDQLLADMQIPHNSGQATSLIERQLAIYRERNVEMRHRLSDLLENARRNDSLFAKTRRLILSIAQANSLQDIQGALDDSLKQDFAVDHWALVHFSDQELEHPLTSICSEEQQRQITRLFKGHRAICGQLTDESTALLFNEETGAQSIASAQVRNTQNLGVLTIGSNDANFYRSSMDTLFLDYIADMLAIRLPQLPDTI